MSEMDAGLLDTKGTILLYAGQLEQAVTFLEAAAQSSDSDPRYLFHLALAYQTLGRRASQEGTCGGIATELGIPDSYPHRPAASRRHQAAVVTMSQTLLTIAASIALLLGTVGAGLIHGRMTNRWEAACRRSTGRTAFAREASKSSWELAPAQRNRTGSLRREPVAMPGLHQPDL